MKKRSLRERAILITGASSGIGRAIALRAATERARIALVSRKKHFDELQALAARVRDLGSEAHVIPCDVIDKSDVLACVAQAEAIFGGVDIAILNAGVGRHRMLIEHDLDDAEHLLRVNLFGALYFAHALAPRMLERGAGSLVFMASLAGLVPVPGEPVYSASKFAIVGLAEALSIELAPTVHVLTVCPGMVRDTNFVRDDERDRIPNAATRTAIDADEVARATLDALAERRTRVIVPAKLAVAVALRGIAPTFVRSATARELAPILELARSTNPVRPS